MPWCGIDTTKMRVDLARHVMAFYASEGRSRACFEVDERDGVDYSNTAARYLSRNWRLVAQRRCFMTALQFFLARYGKLEERLVATEDRSVKST
jgi:hypothetical protein